VVVYDAVVFDYLSLMISEAIKTEIKLYNALKDMGLVSIQKSVFWGHLKSAEVQCFRIFLKNIVKKMIKHFS
jgi:CRISPR/Cas system-associated endoribonuclease Cas2